MARRRRCPLLHIYLAHPRHTGGDFVSSIRAGGWAGAVQVGEHDTIYELSKHIHVRAWEDHPYRPLGVWRVLGWQVLLVDADTGQRYRLR